MRLRDRLKAAVQTFREAPDIHSRLTAAEYQLKIADQTLELMGKECDHLRGTIQEKNSRLTAAEETAEDVSFRLHNTIEEKDSQLRFLGAKADALLYALREFPPRLSTTEDMKRFYDAVSYNLDPDGFTLYRVAQKLSGVDVTSMFPYEEACGMFEEATGHQLMNYLTSYCFGAVEWNTMPGSMYERAEFGEVDTTTPEYQRFERQLSKPYWSAWASMNFWSRKNHSRRQCRSSRPLRRHLQWQWYRRMKYGITAATRPDSPWGRTVRWRCDRYGRPLAFNSEAEAQEAAKAFNDQRCSFEPRYENTVQPLEKEAS